MHMPDARLMSEIQMEFCLKDGPGGGRLDVTCWAGLCCSAGNARCADDWGAAVADAVAEAVRRPLLGRLPKEQLSSSSSDGSTTWLPWRSFGAACVAILCVTLGADLIEASWSLSKQVCLCA